MQAQLHQQAGQHNQALALLHQAEARRATQRVPYHC